MRSKARPMLMGRWAGVVAIGLTLVMTAPTAAYAVITPPVERIYANYGGYSTNSYDTTADNKGWRTLGPELTVPAGATKHLNSIVTVGTLTEGVAEVTAMINCRLPGAPTQNPGPAGANENRTQWAVSGINALKINGTSRIQTQLIVTAPTSTAYVCRLEGIFVNHTGIPAGAGHLYVQADSYLEDVYGVLGGSSQTWATDRPYLLAGQSSTTTAQLEVGTNAVWASGYGDANVTICYGGAAPCAGTYSDVVLNLTATQLNGAGGDCLSYSSSISARVTSTVHHFKLNRTVMRAPVDASCGSTTFRYTLTVTNTGGNALWVEANHQTAVGLYYL